MRTDPKDKTGKYISKKDKKLIQAHLQKRYEKSIYDLIVEEIKRLEKVVSISDVVDKIKAVYDDNPEEVKAFLSPVDISDEEYVRRWMEMPYQKKGFSDGDTTDYYTDNDERVRSKSELNIANMLRKKGIPYKYECPFILSSGLCIYPDFTVLDVKNRREIIWEHRGMMDRESYADHAVRRIKEYEKEGIFLGDGLIITEETASTTLGTREIEAVIQKYFL